jgi:NADH-quinone oxidoreductase subunit C
MSADDVEALAQYVLAAQPDLVTAHAVTHGELTFTSDADQIVALLTFLKTDPRCLFTTLVDICGVDFPARPKRFDVVYHLLSMQKNQRVRIKIQADEATPVPSAIPAYPAADWFEREAFDMYGILFANHPDLRRLLTDYGFQGFPLRKEFPLTGYVEVRYDPDQQRVVYEPVKLTQAYRNFDFASPWEGMPAALPGDEKAKA